MRGKRKYGNRPTNGYASAAESRRAAVLKLLERGGAIRGLREQVRYELIPAQEGERACHYVADFVYEERGQQPDGALWWAIVVEDVKGVRTAEYVIKRKLMLQAHGIRIRELS